MDANTFDPQPTLGALQLGALLSCILFGISTAQVYVYYKRFQQDSGMIKATVAFVWLCEAGHVICLVHTLYTWMILDYGHPERLLGRPPRSFIVIIFITIVIAVAVQVFFSFRIYVLSKRLFIPIFTWILSLLRFISAVAILVIALNTETLLDIITRWSWLATLIWSLSALEDVTITSTLVYLLYKQRAHGHKRTTMLLDRIIAWTIETGLLTSTFSLVTLACFHAMQDNFVWTALFLIEARMFANALFASLNSRNILRDINATGQAALSFSRGAQGQSIVNGPVDDNIEMNKATL